MSNNQQQTKSKSSFGTVAMGAVAIVAAAAGYFVHKAQERSEREAAHQQHRSRHDQNLPNDRHGIPLRPPRDCGMCFAQLSGQLEQLPCQHLFHQACLKAHFNQARSSICPTCSYRLTPAQLKTYQARFEGRL